MRRIMIAALLLLAAATSRVAETGAAEMTAVRDLAYAEPRNERHLLDVYTNDQGSNRPVIFWIHGGGWRRGDKAGVQIKPQVFTDCGYVFVSTNYRFVPDVNIAGMTADIAKAIRWTHDHAKEYGGDGKRIVVVGHSAGAHLAALVCTNDSYLKAEGLSLEIIKGCVPLDVSVYDIPARRKAATEQRLIDAYKLAFGEDEADARKYSPALHVAKGKHIPPFLILYVADRPDTKEQSALFADSLNKAGIQATTFGGENKTHTSISVDLGKPGDPPTEAVYKFLDEVAPPRK